MLPKFASPPQRGQFVSPLRARDIDKNGRGNKLFLYSDKNKCAVSTRDFTPIQTTAIEKVRLSDRQDTVTLTFSSNTTEDNGRDIAIAPVTVPLIYKDVIIPVTQDTNNRMLGISTFEIMRVLRMPTWLPPDYLRFPPHHLRHFYRITDHDAGSSDSDTDIAQVRFCQRIEDTDVVPQYIYSDGAWFLTPDNGETKTALWRIPRKPHWRMEDREVMAESGFYSTTESCRVHSHQCVLKTMRVEPNKPKQSFTTIAKELLVTLMLSIFDVGPEVYDFWFDAADDSVCLLMKRVEGPRVFDIIEGFQRGTPQFEALTVKQRGEKFRTIKGALGTSIAAALNTVRVTSRDMHPRNALVDEKTGRVVPIDFGQVTLEKRPPSPNFPMVTQDERLQEAAESKRRRLEKRHDGVRRLRDPLPPHDASVEMET